MELSGEIGFNLAVGGLETFWKSLGIERLDELEAAALMGMTYGVMAAQAFRRGDTPAICIDGGDREALASGLIGTRRVGDGTALQTEGHP